MEIITKRQRIQEGVARFIDIYSSHSKGSTRFYSNVAQLKLLDTTTCSAECVANIIGNTSWTQLDCDECGQPVQSAVEFISSDNYEDNMCHVCLSCLKQAVEKLEAL